MPRSLAFLAMIAASAPAVHITMAWASEFLILVSCAVMSVSPGLSVSSATISTPASGAAASNTAWPSLPNPPLSVMRPILVMPWLFM